MQTLTEAQASARLEQHLRAAMDQIEPRPSADPGPSATMPCDDPSDGGPPGRVFVEAHDMLRGIPAAANRAVFDALHRYWTANGYEVLRDLRERDRAPLLKVRHGGDGFSVSLRENLAHELSLSGSSPCVWAEGHPPIDGVGPEANGRVSGR
jgi:hypothetical protein